MTPLSGRYRYQLNGEPVAIDERFEIAADGHISSTRETPSGVRITVDAHPSLLDFAVTMAYPGATIEANYEIDADEVRCTRGAAVERAERPSDLVISPILRVFQGPAIRSTASAGADGSASVLVPWIYDPNNRDRLLGLNIEQRRAFVEDDGSYRYVGGNYDDTARFWLDDNGLLTRYVWHQSDSHRWEVRLDLP